MKIGIVKEIKNNENRVSVTPQGVMALVRHGHEVYVQSGAGEGSGFSTEQYAAAGAKILDDIKSVYDSGELIVKVKEPQPEEYEYLKNGQILFTYLHLAVEPELTKVLMKKKISTIAYESVEAKDGSLPLLIPMSEIAGKMSVQIGAHYLESNNGGAGVMLGGVPGVTRGNILIIGAGCVGINALKVAVGVGADVTIADVDLNKLRKLDDMYGSKIHTIVSNHQNLAEACKNADLLIGAVLIPSSKAPCIITEEMVKTMKKGSVIVDVSIDQGGIVETVDRVSTHDDPIYVKHGVLHYSVANIPGAVAYTSTLALANSTLPYILKVADMGLIGAVQKDKSLRKGLNTYKGDIVKQEVADALNMEAVELSMRVGI